MISYPEILSDLFGQKFGIAVTGTHGKTTTSALLANTLKELKLDPIAVVGSKVFNWGGNALVGKGEYFVAEADEFQNKLELYDPKGVILTSVDFDHPDFFKDFSDYKEAFHKFVAKIPKSGFLAVWGDSVDTLEIAQSAICDVLTYGISEDCDFICKKITSEKLDGEKPETRTQKFQVNFRGKDLGLFEIQLVGQHNILNATAVIAVCYKLGLDISQVREALPNFQGTVRRFEYIGKRNDAILIDYYGHHPEELKATLKATRELYPEKNIWAVFHPHTFTRTRALLSEFSQSFDDADNVIVLDIYGSAREEQGGVHSSDLVKAINTFSRDKAEYIPTIKEVVAFLEDKIGSDDVVIAIGAGNVWEVVEKLKEK
jgi:UDP-N-acetylmuramate--alanine ligase